MFSNLWYLVGVRNRDWQTVVMIDDIVHLFLYWSHFYTAHYKSAQTHNYSRICKIFQWIDLTPSTIEVKSSLHLRTNFYSSTIVIAIGSFLSPQSKSLKLGFGILRSMLPSLHLQWVGYGFSHIHVSLIFGGNIF